MSAYADAVERGLDGMDAVSFGPIFGSGHCAECDDAEFSEEIGDEGSFSWSPCGICGSPLGGTRFVWHWLDEDRQIMHETDGCTDCLLFLSNGDEPEEWGE
jgi:hypothetical protein